VSWARRSSLHGEPWGKWGETTRKKDDDDDVYLLGIVSVGGRVSPSGGDSLMCR
jgi:hypothetical protein